MKSNRVLIRPNPELKAKLETYSQKHNLSPSQAAITLLSQELIGKDYVAVFSLKHYLLNQVFCDEFEILTPVDVHVILSSKNLYYEYKTIQSELSTLVKQGKLEILPLFGDRRRKAYKLCSER